MSKLTDDEEAIFADLEARRILSAEPDDLPPAAALVRLPGGMIGEVVLWLDRNPEGSLWFSGSRVALVELVDSVLDTPSSVSVGRAFTEEDITVLRSVPTKGAIQRWLTRWERLWPDSPAQKRQTV